MQYIQASFSPGFVQQETADLYIQLSSWSSP
jgi:hypothetical protein